MRFTSRWVALNQTISGFSQLERKHSALAWAAALLIVGSKFLAVPAGAAEVPFGAQQVISTAAGNANSVVAGDVDGDGDLDVFSASPNDSKIAWYENTSDPGR